MRTGTPILPVVFIGNENFNEKFSIYRRTNMTIKVVSSIPSALP
jgi:hypothetical protein